MTVAENVAVQNIGSDVDINWKDVGQILLENISIFPDSHWSFEIRINQVGYSRETFLCQIIKPGSKHRCSRTPTMTIFFLISRNANIRALLVMIIIIYFFLRWWIVKYVCVYLLCLLYEKCFKIVMFNTRKQQCVLTQRLGKIKKFTVFIDFYIHTNKWM